METEPLHLVIHQLNEETAARAARVEAGDPLQLRWAFMCECGDPRCTSWIELTRAEYTALRRRGGRVIAEGHEGMH